MDRYGSDVLAGGPVRKRLPQVPADPGLVVEDPQTGFVGAVSRVEKQPGGVVVVLTDRHGRARAFPLGPGFWVDGAPVELIRPARSHGSLPPVPSSRTASGSIAVRGAPARVARASRIWVEGRHDAELVERVWGDDLRIEGVVVEELQGVDNLQAALAEFRPGPGRRVAMLVDHLVTGSKESRIAAQTRRLPGAEHVLVLGHPYVDVWQAVKPSSLKLPGGRWPDVPRGVEWKEGVLVALGWPHGSLAAQQSAWRRILGAVNGFADLEPALLGRVEEAIDFVTG